MKRLIFLGPLHIRRVFNGHTTKVFIATRYDRSDSLQIGVRHEPGQPPADLTETIRGAATHVLMRRIIKRVLARREG